MNELSDLENDLKALRPAQPSPVLVERIEEAIGKECRASTAAGVSAWRRFIEAPYNWWSLTTGLAAAAAAVVLVLARINTDQTRNENKEIAQVSPGSERTQALPGLRQPGASGPVHGHNAVAGPTALNKFIPAGAMQVVYNERDEGLQFTDSSSQPVRRLRYQTRETWQWRNPKTGASLRVSYPSEEVILVPVSGQ
jgi:hypothetical protein